MNNICEAEVFKKRIILLNQKRFYYQKYQMISTPLMNAYAV